MTVGIKDSLAETEAAALGLADATRAAVQGAEEEIQASADRAAEILSTMGDDISLEDAKALGASYAEQIGEGITAGLPDDPLAAMLTNFEGAAASIATQSGIITAAINSIPETRIATARMEGTVEFLRVVGIVNSALASIQDKTVTITTNYVSGSGYPTDFQSPTLGIQHALEDVVDFVDKNFPVEFEVSIARSTPAPDLPGYGGSLLDNLETFAHDVERFMDLMVALAKQYKGKGKNIAKNFTAAVAEMLGSVSSMIKSLSTLPDYTSPSQATIDALAEDMGKIMGALQRVARGIEEERIERAEEVIQSATNMAGNIAKTIEGLTALRSYTSPTVDEIAAFERDLRLIMESLLRVAEQFDAETVTATEDMMNAALTMAGNVDRAVKGITSLRDYSSPAPASVGAFARDLEIVVNAMLSVAAKLNSEGVIASEELLDSATAIAANVGQAVGGLVELLEYPHTWEIALNASVFVRDLQVVVNALLTIADNFKDGVIASEELLDSATSIAAGVGQAIRGMIELTEYPHTWDIALNTAGFVRDLQVVVNALLGLAATFEAEGVIAAEDMVDAATSMAADVGRAVGGLVDLASYYGISATTIDRFVSDLGHLVGRLATSLEAMTPEEAEQMAATGEMLASIGQGIGSGFQALVDIATYRGGLDLGLDSYLADLQTLLDAYVGIEAMLPPAETAETIGNTLEALGRGVAAAFDALVSIATYRGGIGAGLEAFISDIYLLASAMKDLGSSIPDWLVPGSPTPLELGLRGISTAAQQASMALPMVMQPPSNTYNISVGPNTISNGMDLAGFEARTMRVVNRALREG